MTEWYYHARGGERSGPMSADALRAALADGRIGRDTLVWRPGAGDWQPLERHAAELELGDAAATAATVAGFDGAAPYAPPRAAIEDLTAGYQAAGGEEVVYAGFWRRAAALLIDGTVITIAWYIILFAGILAIGVGSGFNSQAGPGTGMMGMMAALYFAYPVLSAVYYVGFESSPRQATLGKMAVGIKVTDGEGRRLGRGQALGRWASHLLCYLTLYIGYIMAGITARKRGLHDLVAGTLVVDRWAFTHEPGRQQRGLGTVAIIVLVLGLLLAVAYVAIMAAIAIPAYQAYVQRAAGGG